MAAFEMTTRHIGAAGEVLVQYKLLKVGIDSSRMTTDYGIDLLACSGDPPRTYSIQVKTKAKPVPAGGKGRLALGWFIRDTSPADLVATVDLSTDRVWLFKWREFKRLAQQHSKNGKLQLYMYLDDEVQTKHETAHVSQFENYLIEKQGQELLVPKK